MKHLIKYFNKRKSTIDSILGKSNSKYTSKTIHKLRVEIKKLNALFDLINFCENDFKQKKTFEPFKLIFQQAGKVRELQLEEAMLKKHLANNSISNYLNNIIRKRLKEEEEFYLMLNKESTNGLKIKYHKIVPFLKRINNTKANQYLEKKKNIIINSIGQNALETHQVHKLRKRLKMLSYNMQSLFSEFRKQDSSKQDILPDLLGKWHDCQLMTQHLEDAIEDAGIKPDEINQLEKIKSKIDSDSEILFSKINTTIPEHLQILNKFALQLYRQQPE